MSRMRGGGGLFWGSFGFALLLGLLPMPMSLAIFKPYWLALVLCYWLLEAPERAGLGLAFVLGVVGDLLFGTLLGEQAMRLTILTFIVLRFRPRLRFFTLAQQALAVFALLLNDRIVVLMVRGFSGEGLPPWTFWLSPVVGLLLWPWLFLLLDDLRLKLRQKDA
ncbi:MAG: rod shape-determining protein MreD [Chiayiivirga sp.]|jgi:rod shape-determining protein MreD|uniref:rod shape-determining protein MreD n=1 Tax=Chiayiivirga sp. TaxID=2041042 RepID=UPI0025BDC48B|nr:rod shape-determining protein MreD [Chiayiivirga sp.]MCI1710950.1 rod shape-determining protein MreD [Chiayiivirga sp.]MCI1728254.1 rod shape-determining protein MreD [Chiayiivirga sp.]